MTEFRGASREPVRCDFDTIVDDAIQDATDLFRSRSQFEFASVARAEEKFITYAFDMYAVRAVGIDDITNEPSNPSPIVEHRAASAFVDTFYDDDFGSYRRIT